MGQNDEAVEGEDKSVHFRRSNDAFKSDLYWGFLELIFIFSMLLQHLSNWTTSCICHPSVIVATHELEDEKHQCYMRGRRVPEIT